MSTIYEPNPPSRRAESFPKTTTIPEGWNGEALKGSNPGFVPNTGENATDATRPTVDVDESLFSRRLDPFPKPNTIPSGWDLSELG